MPANDEFMLELLLNAGLIAARDIPGLRESSSANGHGIIDEIVSQGLVSREDIMRTLAADCAMDFIPSIETIEEDAVALMSKANAQRYCAIPLRKTQDGIQVAIADPLDFDTIDALRHLLGAEIEPLVAPLDAIQQAITKYYGSTDEALANLTDDGTDLTVKTRKEDDDDSGSTEEGDAPIIRMVHGIIMDAHRMRASDIHIEPMEKRLRLRYRIDGVLQEMRDPPKRLQSSILSRIKLTAGVSIAEKRLPQDGRIALTTPGSNTRIDLRVSTVPTVHGESIVMRILDKKALLLGLPELGFFADDQNTIERVLGFPDGIFLVTGPTGSGKSTTLYACLNTINKPDRKIITVEDPVEYQLPGINQVQVNADVGMTFAAALRSMLRQAPNIIMVGEIRDMETATIAINASLTGHLVFSTLHTNDAPSAVTRLVDMGIKPFLVSSSIRAVMAQRLVRKICSACGQPYSPTDAELRGLNLQAGSVQDARFMMGRGCDNCRGSGYRGRMGIFELFTVDDDIRNLVNESGTLSELRDMARDKGMRTLREDGVRKVIAGSTTPEEVISATVGDKN